MRADLKKPCDECPFRRASPPGWLGADTPEGFLRTAMADTSMPCHQTVDYELEDWNSEARLAKAQYCAGNAIFFANICKLSRDKKRLKLAPDKEKVFSRPDEFLVHHTSTSWGRGQYQHPECPGTTRRRARKRA